MEYEDLKVTEEILEEVFARNRAARDNARKVIGEGLWKAFKWNLHKCIREQAGHPAEREYKERGNDLMIRLSGKIANVLMVEPRAVWVLCLYGENDCGVDGQFVEFIMEHLFSETDEELRAEIKSVFTTENLQQPAATKGKEPRGLKILVDVLFQGLKKEQES